MTIAMKFIKTNRARSEFFDWLAIIVVAVLTAKIIIFGLINYNYNLFD